MATFDIERDIWDFVYYNFYIINHTQNTVIEYDFRKLLNTKNCLINSEDQGNKRVAIKTHGTLSPSERHSLLVQGRSYPDRNFELGIVELIAIRDDRPHVSNYPVEFRFWSGGGNHDQYINLKQNHYFKITSDSASYNAIHTKKQIDISDQETNVDLNQYKVTLDSGGRRRRTDAIFIQIYDSTS